MKQPRAVKTVKVVGVSGLVVTALMTNWTGIAVLVVAVILALCWVLDDHDRAKRFTVLVSTWRYGIGTSPRRRAVVAPRPRAVTRAPRAIGKPPTTS